MVKEKQKHIYERIPGVAAMAKWVKDLAEATWVPGPVKWIKDPALLQLWRRSQLWLGFNPRPRTSICCGCEQKNKKKFSSFSLPSQRNTNKTIEKPKVCFKICLWGVPIEAQRKQTSLAFVRTQVRFLASLSGLRIRCCHELWYRLQVRLRSRIVVAVVQAGSYSSD